MLPRLAKVVFLLAIHSACADARAESFLSEANRPQANQCEITAAADHLDITYTPADYPNVTWSPSSGLWNWTDSGGLFVEAENLDNEEVVVHLRIDNPGADGTRACNRATLTLPARTRRELRVRINTNTPTQLWGMRGLPGLAPAAEGPALDPAAITAFQLFLHHPTTTRHVRLHRVELLPPVSPMPLPFVDRFGQYRHADWPGKLQHEEELRGRVASEPLDAAGLLGGANRYGGWAEGPRLEATGFFRTAEHKGRWWLVTPDGALFFSLGIDCVGTWEGTFIESRDRWFEWLPSPADALFGPLIGHASGAHELSGLPGGAGRTFSFYRANLVRKFGEHWQEAWQLRAYQRLRAWNFNTLGNWAQAEVIRDSPLPYVASCALNGLPIIESSQGHWAKMYDVFAPEFREGAARLLADMTKSHRDRPLCLGYFVDNELAWEGVIDGVLRSPSTQPARQELLRFLQERYPTLGALNVAWATTIESFDAVVPGVSTSENFKRDMDEFLHHFARTYFEAVSAALHASDPHHLYLGCRFASAPAPVVRAAAEFADVVSYNLYQAQIYCTPLTALDKPVIIGEFHFGATDRGLFHPGISATRTQAERAAAYTHYITTAAKCPAIVGAHWFQFIDEPLTGRWHDGENYNIGFVDVTDTPYPELVAAATAANGEIYGLRSTD